MRVTQSMMNQQVVRNLTDNNERLLKLQNMLASGKKINSPSDDPVGVGYALRYRSYVQHNEQYVKNADAAKSFLDFTDTTLNQVNDVLQRARTLAVQGANGSLTVEDRQAIAQEVDQLYDQLIQIGNTQFNGKYIFNGTQTESAPYPTSNPWTASPNNKEIKYPLGEGITLPVNISGEAVFGSAASDPTMSDNAFAVLNQLSVSLKSNDQGGIEQALAHLQTRLDAVQQARADIGARSNRADLLKNRLEDMNLNYQTLISTTEDADIAQTITDLKMAENVQQASLAAGARVIQKSLVDYLS